MFRLIFSLVFFLNLSQIAMSESNVDGMPIDDTVVTQAQDLPTLIGGREAREGELPISVFIQNCTASVVGPNVILTAGHCRSSGSDVSFIIGRTRHSGTCTRHPNFNNNSLDNDFTLCKVSPRINLRVFADLSPINVRNGDQVTMQGFGNDRLGTLQVGTAQIVQINNQDLITNSRVKLGGGDSGGGLFLGTPNLERGPFQLIGINSRVSRNGNNSFFNRINLQRTQDFFQDFARDERVAICGVNDDCRVGGGNGGDCAAEAELVRFHEDQLDAAKRVLRECQDNS